MRKLLIGAAALCVVLGVTACATPGSGPASAPDTNLTVALKQDPGSIDPLGAALAGADIVFLYGETLTKQYVGEGLEPGLATEWHGSEDLTEWTFTLRDDVVFSDGSPMTSTDVVATFERIMDPDIQSPYKADLAFITGVKATGEHEVVFSLDRPLVYFPASVSEFLTVIMKASSFEENGNTYERIVAPVTTGPYALTSYQADAKAVLARNDNYWNGEPGFEQVEFRFIPEATAREAMIRSGEIDITMTPPTTSLEALRNDPRVTVETAPGLTGVYLGINLVNEPKLQDIRVREAMNLAIDRESIIDNVLLGLGDALTSPISSVTPGACAVGESTYDPERAKQLLAEAGAEGTAIDFLAPNGRYLQDAQASAAIASQLQEVGFTVKSFTRDATAYLDEIRKAPEDASFDIGMFVNTPSLPDTGLALNHWFGERITPNGFNFAGYQSDVMDDLKRKSGEIADPEARAEVLCEALKVTWEDYPAIWLWAEQTVTLTNGTVDGVDVSPRGILRLAEATPASN